MKNKLGYGTSCEEDCILNEQLAEVAAEQKRRRSEDSENGISYFIQEYEESRAWNNDGKVART